MAIGKIAVTDDERSLLTTPFENVQNNIGSINSDTTNRGLPSSDYNPDTTTKMETMSFLDQEQSAINNDKFGLANIATLGEGAISVLRGIGNAAEALIDGVGSIAGVPIVTGFSKLADKIANTDNSDTMISDYQKGIAIDFTDNIYNNFYESDAGKQLDHDSLIKHDDGINNIISSGSTLLTEAAAVTVVTGLTSNIGGAALAALLAQGSAYSSTYNELSNNGQNPLTFGQQSLLYQRSGEKAVVAALATFVGGELVSGTNKAISSLGTKVINNASIGGTMGVSAWTGNVAADTLYYKFKGDNDYSDKAINANGGIMGAIVYGLTGASFGALGTAAKNVIGNKFSSDDFDAASSIETSSETSAKPISDLQSIGSSNSSANSSRSTPTEAQENVSSTQSQANNVYDSVSGAAKDGIRQKEKQDNKDEGDN